MRKIERALVSVSDKTGIVEFAKALSERGVEILSTGGTSAALRKALIPVIDLADYTGFPEILDGRLKTLHPRIHGGLLGRRDNPRHQREMKENGIGPIDMVIVNLYPFEATVARKDCTFDEAIENIDIGGPSMIRSAAKNHLDVAAVVDPADYTYIIDEMDKNAGALTAETKFRLTKKAFKITASYDIVIMNYLNKIGDNGEALEWPAKIGFVFEEVFGLRYGENPHQKAAFYREIHPSDEPSLVGARQIQGKGLSYNNIMDADAAIEMVQEFAGGANAAIIVKHATPCGAAVSQKSLLDAYEKALDTDPVSAFGGIIGFNRRLDEATARAISETFYEVVAAPSFEDAALAILSKKKNLRLLEIPGLGGDLEPSGLSFRKVAGGLLLQTRDTGRENIREAKVVTKRAPTEEEWAAMEFAWKICRHVKSNAIVYASAARTLGIGAGQTSRIDSARIAAMKMQQLKHSNTQALRHPEVMAVASDAFFPFRDGIDAAYSAGATAAIEPGGSLRDEEAIAAADGHGMAMVFTGIRHFRH